MHSIPCWITPPAGSLSRQVLVLPKSLRQLNPVLLMALQVSCSWSPPPRRLMLSAAHNPGHQRSAFPLQWPLGMPSKSLRPSPWSGPRSKPTHCWYTNSTDVFQTKWMVFIYSTSSLEQGRNSFLDHLKRKLPTCFSKWHNFSVISFPFLRGFLTPRKPYWSLRKWHNWNPGLPLIVSNG